MVLDEASANVDMETDEALQAHLAPTPADLTAHPQRRPRNGRARVAHRTSCRGGRLMK